LYRFIFATALIFTGVTYNAYADDIKVEFSGFASLALSYSDDPDIAFSPNYLNIDDTGWSATRDSILGGQANISLANNWDSVVQFVLEDHANTDFENYLELAFLRYRPSRNWAIRAGRLNSDLYLLSEYPHVGYAYLWVRPPHEYYSFASTAGKFDGVDIEYSQSINDGFLRLKLAAGNTTAKLKASGQDFLIDFDHLMTFSATYVLDAWTMRFSVSQADVGDYKFEALNEFIDLLNSVPAPVWPQAASLSASFDTKNHSIEYAALGLTYDSDNWLIQSEIGISESPWLVASSNINGYVSVGYRLDKVTLFSSVSISENRHKITTVTAPQFLPGTPIQVTFPLQQLALASKEAVDRLVVHQHSINVGVKWQASENLIVKAQIDHFDIQPFGGGLWGISDPENVEKEHRINVFTVSANMVF
jgi:hypothetical protein